MAEKADSFRMARDSGIDWQRMSMAVTSTGMPTKHPGGFQDPSAFERSRSGRRCAWAFAPEKLKKG
jgi:hypothetical protein